MSERFPLLNRYQALQRGAIPSADDLAPLWIVMPDLQRWIRAHLRFNASGRSRDKWQQIAAGNMLEILAALRVNSGSVLEAQCWRGEFESAMGQTLWNLFALCEAYGVDLGHAIARGADDFCAFREERYGTDVIERLRQAVLDSMRTVHTGGSYRSKV